jgi:uncharacterized protein YutE (UPF0331/DUF86 family)
MVRRDLVRRKLALIAEDLERLAVFRDETLESLKADQIRMAAVERMLERVVMRAIDVNEHLARELAGEECKASRLTYRDTFLMLAGMGVYPSEFAERIAASAGLRNILVHDYNDADRRIVHSSILTCLRDYYEYAGYVSAFIGRLPE